MKHLSEIGDALRPGSCLLRGFSAFPVEGQRIEDVARAHTIFLEKVAELHPDALGKPSCSDLPGRLAAMMAACMRPDVVGPMVIAGAPLSYSAGSAARTPSLYRRSFCGTWLDRMMSDIGNGSSTPPGWSRNFDNLNPANTFMDQAIQRLG